MFFKKLLPLVAACLLLAGDAFAAAPLRMSTVWLDEHETFLIWYAKQRGWDKEAGLDVNVRPFGSGIDVLNALPAEAWDMAGMGAVPAPMLNLRHDARIVAVGNDEAAANAVLVRPDGPIAKASGVPGLLGDAATVRGKTFLTTTLSSAHYALHGWLKALGLTERDVTIKNMDQELALAAFANGIGDGVALWAPHLYEGRERGWLPVSVPRTGELGNPIVLLADKAFSEAHPEAVAAFLGVYLRAVDAIRREAPEALVPEYRRFFREWAGKEYSETLALADLKSHPVFPLEEQLALFDASQGPSAVQRRQADIALFYRALGSITDEEFRKVENGGYATDRFLKRIAASR